MSTNIHVKEYQNQNNNEQIIEYRNLIRCTSPYCNCGNCILKKNRDKDIIHNFPYGKNTKSIYMDQYQWANPENQDFNNKIKNNIKKGNLDNCFKEYLKNGLVSVMKNDYKPLISEPHEQFIPKDNLNNSSHPPFLGRSNYAMNFQDWHISAINKNHLNHNTLLNVPFSGKSSYKENFERFNERYYLEKTCPVIQKDYLQVTGRFVTESTSKESYKQIDLKKSKDINLILNKNNRSSILNPPYTKDSFLSSYERAFMFNNFNNGNKIGNL